MPSNVAAAGPILHERQGLSTRPLDSGIWSCRLVSYILALQAYHVTQQGQYDVPKLGGGGCSLDDFSSG